MWQRNVAAAATMLLLGGCASAPPAIPVAAVSGETEVLVGEWNGDYAGTPSGRQGTIHFVLRSGSDSAYGEVLMVPAGYNAPRTPEEMSEHIRRPLPQVLSIAFVHVERGTFTGRLEPYRDPECGCPLTTVFTGSLSGPDEIRGTFVTTGPPGHATQNGEWRVRRIRH